MHVIINIDFAQHVLIYGTDFAQHAREHVEFAQNAMQMNI